VPLIPLPTYHYLLAKDLGAIFIASKGNIKATKRLKRTPYHCHTCDL